MSRLARLRTQVMEGPRRLEASGLDARVRARLLEETYRGVESRARYSSTLYAVIVGILLWRSSYGDAHPDLMTAIFVATSGVSVFRIALTGVVWRLQLPPGRLRLWLFAGPLLVAGGLWSAFCCLAAFHMAGTWVPILLSATCGLGALAAIVYFAAFGRITLAYALILTLPIAGAVAVAEQGEGPAAAQVFMGFVFVLLVLPMLAKLHKDHWDAVIGRAVADERAHKAETTALQAQRESADKSAFLAQVGHEIRTPMNGILGMTELLLGTKLDEAQRNYARLVLSSAESLLSLLNDLLDAARLEAGRTVLDRRAFALARTVREAAGLFAGAARNKGIELVLDVEGLPEAVVGDRSRLRQVVSNLVGNAVKFTDHGKVTVRARAHDHDHRLTVEVIDSGVGVDPALHPRLFERFSPLSGARGGTGLGLSICKDLVTLMGGTLGVESPLGGAAGALGSRFFFSIPIEPTLAEGALATAARVLIVEDDAVSRQVARVMLERLGCSVVEARTGKDALSELQKSPIDVVLMDCQMPEMDGYEATRAIRAPPFSVTVPIVALTAHTDDDNLRRCIDVGMDAVLTKPISTDALHSAIARFRP